MCYVFTFYMPLPLDLRYFCLVVPIRTEALENDAENEDREEERKRMNSWNDNEELE